MNTPRPWSGNRRGIPTLGFGPAANELSHRPNERVSVDELEAAARGYAALCEALTRHLATRGGVREDDGP